jgi:hypothetical protein
MKIYAWMLMLCAALLVGCGAPVDEAEPTVTPNSGEGEHSHSEGDHDHGDHDHADHDHGEHEEGDHEHAEGEHSEASGDDQASEADVEKIRFVADKKISVPEMMCPYGCWPSIQKALAEQPGVEGVQLAEQPEGTPEGEIKERVVELKLNDEFDESAAIAALKDINFDATILN